MAQKQSKKAEAGKAPLVCTFGKCKKLQTEDGEFCEKHGKLKNFDFEITVKWVQYSTEAENKKRAIEIIKESFLDEYNLELTNKEIKLLK